MNRAGTSAHEPRRTDGNGHVVASFKQPKRGMISCEKGYIEIMEYPRAWESRITYVETGDTEVVRAGENADALAYELADMEKR